jgi:hypothetical protein
VAEWNAGESALAAGMLGPSGKFGTPRARMHLENARHGFTDAAVRLELREEPQAVSPSRQVAAANAIRYRVHRRLRILFRLRSRR